MPDFVSPDTLDAATAAITSAVYPGTLLIAATLPDLAALPPVHAGGALFNNPRGAAQLWSKITAQTEDEGALVEWRTSKVRRTYLVALGMPVDLDEVLPSARAQERLVITSRTKKVGATPSASTAQPSDTPALSTPLLAPPPPPEFDYDHARQLARVSDAALQLMTESELKAHLRALEDAKIAASIALAHWMDARSAAAQNKEYYESVIDSSIEYAQRVRTQTTMLAAVQRAVGGGGSGSTNGNGR
ncbi:uncharacterized protein V1518DRAFT_422623 [Limtongia smithiae]|uniref:uncharacterized protein n=1 Tax=Limtongia smithiae TaxID=1125753 RepID=UPI0034CF0FED